MTTPAAAGRPPKTHDRILDAALTLFNERGERNVSTNHIAATLSISPGNLYYYFRNKEEIIYQLFQRYAAEVEHSFDVPDERELTWQDKMRYFESILESMWSFRFFHRDLEDILTRHELLRTAYGRFTRRVMDKAQAIYAGMRRAGLIEANDAQIDALILNTWVIATSWTTFLHVSAATNGAGSVVTKAMIKRGVYQIICLEEPYVRGEAALHLPEIQAYYYQQGVEAAAGALPLLRRA